MNNRQRNGLILLLVAVLLAVAALIIIPGSPISKPTRLGLDLKGGVELVYQGRPTPQVPKVTPQAIDDAIKTIRKRTDALGVSEPEIQRSGSDQISIGLPAVKNADRAEQQVGTTAQLQFYDWEPNLINQDGQYAMPPGGGEPVNVNPIISLYTAVQAGSKAKPKAEPTDIPPGGPSEAVKRQFAGNQQKIEQYYDRKNDTGGDKYYLFGPGPTRQILRPGQAATGGASAAATGGNDATAYYETCGELQQDREGSTAKGVNTSKAGKPDKNTACPQTMAQLTKQGAVPAGSQLVKVPRGIVVIKAEKQPSGTGNNALGYYVLEDDSELSGADIKDPKQEFDPQTQEPVVTFKFTDKGRAAFARATKREAERGAQILKRPGLTTQDTFQRFAIALDNQVVSLATVSYTDNPEGIDGQNGAQITGIGSIQETQDLAQNLRIGALPIGLKLISKTQVSATLGKQALHEGLVAGAVGLLLTLSFLILFYRVLGVIAGVALISYAVLLFALVKLIPITMTLPGIAGLILTLGVAADANIVIFERVKEEARAGRSIPAAVSSGYAKALRTIIDANVVTIGVAFILFMLATAGVKGFAFTLLIGTLTSLLTAVLATHAMISSLSRTKLLRSRWALRIGSTENRTRFDFSGASKWFFSASGAIIAAGAIAIAAFGINFGIDFTSGTRITTPIQQKATVQQVQNALAPLGYGDAKVQTASDPELGPNVVQIRTKKLDPAKVDQVEQTLNQKFGVPRADFSASSIGPTFGQEIARTAIIAVIASLILISIYIGLRFEFKFAVPVLIALAHDMLITAGVYALFQREVTTSTVAALLTILGYSLYDTIIVFDRIRENVPRMPRATFSQIVNRSMSEVIVRSLVTSLSTLLPITALMLFGGETLRDFGFALLVGVASGAYSSIFIAAPVLVHWKEREPVWRRRTRIVREDHGGVVPAYADITLGEDAAPRPAIRRDRDRAAARRRAAAARGPTAPRGQTATTELVPPDDGGNGVPDGDGLRDGDGDGASATPPEPRQERPARPKPKQKPRAGNRRRRRHGR